MKFVTALILWAAGIAQAQTTAATFAFQPASDYSCLTYCTGYFASIPEYTIAYVNLQYAGAPGYRLTVSLNGKTYQGYVPSIFEGGVLYNTYFDPVTQRSYSDGTFIALTDVNYTYKHTCTRSGRGQHCTSWYFVTTGSITP